MKKILALVISFALVLLAGCSGDIDSESNGETAGISGETPNLDSMIDEEEDWIEIDCPLCDGGRKKDPCYVCDGTGYMFNGQRICSHCHGVSGGTDFCYVCDDKSSLTVINYEKDKNAMTPDEISEKIEALGERSRNLYKCTACNGGKDSGDDMCRRCSNVGYVINNNYDEESEEWDEKLEEILNECIYVPSEKTENSGDSGSSDYDYSWDDYNYNYNYNSGSVKRECYSCRGKGIDECIYCSGSGGKYIRGSAPGYSGVDSANDYQYWQDCFKCYGSGTVTCMSCNGSGTIG